MNLDELIKKGFVERMVMKTPSGGDYSEAHYLDDARNYTAKDDATQVIIKEYKSDGTLLNESFMFKKKLETEVFKLAIIPGIKNAIDNIIDDIYVDMLIEKGLYQDGKLTDIFYKLYRNYKILLDQYLLKILPLKELDDTIINSDLKFVPVSPNNMDSYQSLSSMKLQYVYLRNKLSVEKLSQEEINILINLSDEQLANPSEELFNLIDDTYKNVIDSKKTALSDSQMISYGVDIKDYWIDSSEMVFGIRYDLFADNGLGDEDDWEENYFNQNKLMIELIKKMEPICSEQLGVKTHFLRFDDTAVKKTMLKR